MNDSKEDGQQIYVPKQDRVSNVNLPFYVIISEK